MSISTAVVGYGPAFGMGHHHSEEIIRTPGLQLSAICDVDPAARRQAAQDYDVKVYDDVQGVVDDPEIDMVVLVTPHNTHAPLALKALGGGKHVVVEKPMCITYRQATEMIEAAEKSKVMLSVFHNRRWDGDYMAIKQCIDRGTIGEVFHLEAFMGEWSKPRKWWRSDKAVSGGAFYDWGAHVLDWMLGFLGDAKMERITGFYHANLVWKNVTNEDQVRAIVEFDTGCVADVQLSSIAFVGKPRWRILGTRGAIEDQSGGDSFTVHTEHKGYPARMTVPYAESGWHKYYQSIAAHLNRGTELTVKPEEARRTIAIMETAEKSAQAGKPLEAPCP